MPGQGSKYLAELSNIQRWVKSVTGLSSYRNTAAPPQLPRPVIVWEAPNRGKDRNLTRWAYVNKVTQYGRLYVVSVDQLADLQDKLMTDLEERVGVLPIYGADDTVVALLKKCEIVFYNAESLDVSFNITYEATYTRGKPAAAPNAVTVGNRIQSNVAGYDVKNY